MELKKAISCNCSICSKRGSLLDIVPASNFKFLTGEKDLTDYQFNKKIFIIFSALPVGFSPLAEGHFPVVTKMIAINVRCLEDHFLIYEIYPYQH